ncbi:thioredoxin family protein [Halovenus salina]|uniref:Thioredoxin family protein n=1 Tax=Halovenus salina TaxID=1510225 RepID=A0ABD5VZK6_9EURY|nr:thioredoxin family protein [Halovenus salina]
MVELESTDVLTAGDEAPDFELQGTDGDSYSLADFEEYEALLVVFTCNHCPYAKATFEEMNRLAEEFDEAAVVGINPNDATEYPEDDFETMGERVEEGTIRWDAYLHDETQSVAAAYGAMCTPDPFLFENTGTTFRLAYHGRLDDAPNPDDEASEREMAGHIKTVLAGDEIAEEPKPSRGCSIKWKTGNEPDYWDQ